MYYEDYVDCLNGYALILEHKFLTHRIGYDKFSRLLDKLEQWEDMFIQKYDIE